jgi:hypothetical protein
MPDKTTFTQTFTEKDPKNHSIRWNASEKDASISSLYIGKAAGTIFTSAKRIRITVEVLD